MASVTKRLVRSALMLFISITSIPYSMTSILPADCYVQKHDLLNCEYSIPRKLPAGVTRVHIRGYNQSVPISINDEYEDWKQVIELDVNIDQALNPFFIYDNAFTALKNLKSLGILGRNVDHVYRFALAGLDSLENLDFSGCIQLSFKTDIVPAIVTASFQKLTSLNISGVDTFYPNYVTVDTAAIEMLRQKFVASLNMSNSNIYIEKVPDYKPLPMVVFDISNVTLVTNFKTEEKYSQMFSNLKALYASNNPRYNFLQWNYVNAYQTTCAPHSYDIYGIPLEYIYADKVTSGPIILQNSTIDFTVCPIRVIKQLKYVSMRFNHIEKLDATFVFPDNILLEVDFSHNDISYISPTLFKDAKSLKVLNVAYNNLTQMEKLADFDNLLEYLISLQDFSISHNHIRTVPYDRFSRNKRLRIIDISWNYLENVAFRVEHLEFLTHLRLSNNRIKTLQERFRMSLTALLQLQTNLTNQTIATINLENNDLVCSCETKTFIRWLIDVIVPTANNVYTCKMDGEVKHIHSNILQDIDYLCIRTAVVICGILSSGIAVTIIIVGIVFVIHKRYKEHHKDLKRKYLNAFREETLLHGKTQVKYIAFLAHASADVVAATETVYKQLDNTFRAMTGVNRSTICMGNKHFLPGFNIIEQTMKCLDQSCVAIVVISRSFCESHWCEIELKEAYQQQKPIVLIFTEMIDEGLKSPILLNIFGRQTRAMLHYRDGQYVLEPSWDAFCEAVVALTTTHSQHNQPKLNQCQVV